MLIIGVRNSRKCCVDNNYAAATAAVFISPSWIVDSCSRLGVDNCLLPHSFILAKQGSLRCAPVPLAIRHRKPRGRAESNYNIIATDFASRYCVAVETVQIPSAF